LQLFKKSIIFAKRFEMILRELYECLTKGSRRVVEGMGVENYALS
jgi:hypothetical protein